MTNIVKEMRENGGWAVITRSSIEGNYIYRAIIMGKEKPSFVPDANNIEEVIYECECRLRDFNKKQ